MRMNNGLSTSVISSVCLDKFCKGQSVMAMQTETDDLEAELKLHRHLSVYRHLFLLSEDEGRLTSAISSPGRSGL